MEILDLYDDLGQKMNETIVRGTKPDNGKNIMLSVVFIKNDKGEYLIQKTSNKKGGKYASTGGHVAHNEDAFTTIIREIKEELGLDDIKSNIVHIETFKYPNKPCIFNVYLLIIDNIDIDNLVLQQEEVAEINWFTTDEIDNLINENLFQESHAYIFKNYILK